MDATPGLAPLRAAFGAATMAQPEKTNDWEEARAMRVLICDDHSLFGEGFRFLLESLQPGVEIDVATSAEEAAALLAGDEFDLLLLDWNLEGPASGEDALALLRDAAPAVRIVVLSGERDARLVRKMIDLGAAGFIPKASRTDALQAALQAVLAGQIYLPPDFHWSATDTAAPLHPTDTTEIEHAFPTLTPRQASVLKIVLRGSPDKLIAREMGISPNTVRSHLKAIYAELGVQTRGEAVYLASRRGVRIS